MMSRSLHLLTFALLAGVAHALPVQGGRQNPAGGAVPGMDSSWNAPVNDSGSVPASDAKTISIPRSAWLASSTGSSWIWQQVHGHPVRVVRQFAATFDLTALEAARASTFSRPSAESFSLNIFIGNVAVAGSPPGYWTWTYFTIASQYLLPEAYPRPTELRAAERISGFPAGPPKPTPVATVPDHGSTVALVGLALLVIGCLQAGLRRGTA